MTPTAEEILNTKHKEFVNEVGLSSIHTTNFPEAYKQQALKAMKEIASLSWEAGGEYEYRSNFGKVPTDAPTKESFMKKLFEGYGK